MGAQHLGFPPISLVWRVTPRIVWPVALSITAIVGAIYLLTRVDNEDERLTLAVKEGVESTALKEIARSFSQEKHVAVEVIDLPYDDLYTEELRQLKQRPERSRDTVPPFDVIMVDDPWLYSLVSVPGAAPRLENLSMLLRGKEDEFLSSTLRVSTYCSSSAPCSDYHAVPLVAPIARQP